jgi:hypothetical protein
VRWFSRRRRERREVSIPRSPEIRQKRFIHLSNPHGMLESDWNVLRANEIRVELAYRLGLDLALRRSDGHPEYLIAGEEPPAKNGFVVVRNQDA